MRLFEMCLLSLALWQFNVPPVTVLTRCALGLQLPGGTETHPTPWPWLGLPHPEPHCSKGRPAQPCHLVLACQRELRGCTRLCARILPRRRAASPWPCLNPTAAAARGSKCLAAVEPQGQSEGKLLKWLKLPEKPLCGPFFMLELTCWVYPLLHAFPAQELINTTDICSITTGISLRTQQMNGMVQSYCLRLSTDTK